MGSCRSLLMGSWSCQLFWDISGGGGGGGSPETISDEERGHHI